MNKDIRVRLNRIYDTEKENNMFLVRIHRFILDGNESIGAGTHSGKQLISACTIYADGIRMTRKYFKSLGIKLRDYIPEIQRVSTLYDEMDCCSNFNCNFRELLYLFSMNVPKDVDIDVEVIKRIQACFYMAGSHIKNASHDLRNFTGE